MQSRQKYSLVILSVWKVSHSPSQLGLNDHPLHTLDVYMGLRSTLATCAWGTEVALSSPRWELVLSVAVSGEGVVVAVALPSFHIGSDLLACAHKKKASIFLPSWEDGGWSLHFSALFRVSTLASSTGPMGTSIQLFLSLDQEQDRERKKVPELSLCKIEEFLKEMYLHSALWTTLFIFCDRVMHKQY